MSQLRLYNSLTGKLEEFVPAGPTVTMYVCGPTVYGQLHVGNARPVVVFDVLYRVLRKLYDKVSYARNITDIDDKIIAAADKQGVAVPQLAEKYATQFTQFAAALGSLPPTYEPKATEHIGEMVALAEALIAKQHAYVEQGHVLFAPSTFPAYGQLSNRSVDEMLAGARVEVASYKRNAADFVLWKPSEPQQPGWSSPWGRGRPGWHLECSAMIKSCLGETIDIHGGGRDLEFPHHENEIAQSCCALGIEQLARFWVHNGHVTWQGRKMAKSVGNFTTLSEALGSYPGEVIRYALLTAHYRQPLEFSSEVLDVARASLDRLYRALADEPLSEEAATPEVDCKCEEALLNDLNTPQALAQLHEYARVTNSATGKAAQEASAQLRNAAQLLGLLVQDPQDWLSNLSGIGVSEEWIRSAVAQRTQARAAADYATADRLRDELDRVGIAIEDSAGGTSWRRK